MVKFDLFEKFRSGVGKVMDSQDFLRLCGLSPEHILDEGFHFTYSLISKRTFPRTDAEIELILVDRAEEYAVWVPELREPANEKTWV